jgi:hypothetical protein
LEISPAEYYETEKEMLEIIKSLGKHSKEDEINVKSRYRRKK